MSVTAPSLTDVVTERIVERTGRRVRGLQVEIPAGGDRVLLRGRTASYYIKQLAQQAVQEVLPEVLLENTIVVE